MNKNEIIGIVFCVFIAATTMLTFEYLDVVKTKEMINTNLEECPQTPDWSNSGVVWVKDCKRYIESWKKVQDN